MASYAPPRLSRTVESCNRSGVSCAVAKHTPHGYRTHHPLRVWLQYHSLYVFRVASKAIYGSRGWFSGGELGGAMKANVEEHSLDLLRSTSELRGL